VPKRIQQALAVGADEEVTFVEVSATVNYHRDAVRFRTGHTLRLQELEPGQRVEVIDLGYREAEEPIIANVPERLPLAAGPFGRI
jgi:hypothetical protein